MKQLAKLFLTITALVLTSCGEHQHTFSDVWSYDETNHWHAATCIHKDLKSDEGLHVFGEWIIDVDPTETSSGHRYRQCTICPYRIEEDIPPIVHIHTFSDIWSYDETHHWHASTCGHDVVDSYQEHDYEAWVIDKEATTIESGLKHRDCKICNNVEEKIIPQKQEGNKELERIYLQNCSLEVLTSYTAYLNPIAIPYPCEVNYNYEIEDPALLTVNDGVITGVKAGNTIVKVYDDKNSNDLLDDDEIYAVAGVSVKESDPNVSLTFEKDIYELSLGQSETVKYTLSGAKASGFDYGFYSDNEDVCSFANAKIVAHKEGEANISISWKGYRAQAKVRVSSVVEGNIHASEISTEVNRIVICKGETYPLDASILPSNSVDTITNYLSHNETIATVNANGIITGVKSGSTYVEIKTSRSQLSKRIYVVVTDSSEHYDQNFYNNYYGDLSWENGEDLKNKLHDIISKDVTPLRYAEPNWETNQYADQDLYDLSMVDAVYSSEPILKTDTNKGWQREHAFAASLMTGFSTGTAVKSLGRATDFHNLFASDSGANGSRGNKNFGYANSLASDYSTKSECGYTRNEFEPSNTDKGRIARAIFYMGVMYNVTENATVKEKWTFKGPDVETHSTKSTTLNIASKEKPVEIVEDIVDYNKVSLDRFMYPETDQDITLVSYYRALALKLDPSLIEGSDLHRQRAYELYNDASMPYAIGNFNTLLEWNAFSVDYLEMQHNESVYSHNSTQGKGRQGNRNPFVDYPQLVDYVYGDLQNESGSLKDLRPSFISLEMDKDDIHHYAYDSSKEVSFDVGDSFDVSKYNFVAFKNDMSETIVDYAKFSAPSYTFSESDAGKVKEFTVSTDKNSFTLKAKVSGSGGGEGAASLEECKYHYLPTTGNKGDYVGSDKSYVATLGEQAFDVTFESTAALSNKNTAPAGVKIGTEAAHAGKITFVSQNSFTDVDSVYFYAITAASTSYSYTIKVGNDVVLSGSLVSGSTPTYYGDILSSKYSGQVTIEINNVLKALTFCGIGINYN